MLESILCNLSLERGVIYPWSWIHSFSGLSFYTTEKALSEAFSNYGQVIEGINYEMH